MVDFPEDLDKAFGLEAAGNWNVSEGTEKSKDPVTSSPAEEPNENWLTLFNGGEPEDEASRTGENEGDLGVKAGLVDAKSLEGSDLPAFGLDKQVNSFSLLLVNVDSPS